ncbi:MAG TPA: hypothetical protein PKB02_13140, partial [Anaerohalosphaeraceae bacterium]|nr:hypothetical protein [Anaerohalosphaeraceae bacterium]
MATLQMAIDAAGAVSGANTFAAAGDKISGVANRTINAVTGLSGAIGRLLAIGGASFSLVYLTKEALTAEKAQRDLSAALDVVGANTRENMAILRDYASHLQSISRFGDDAILSQMAFAKNTGVATTELKAATEAAIELAVVYRMDLENAMQLVSRAYKGQTEMLSRYGIILDTTKTKEEQWIQLKDQLRSKFDLIKKDADSTEGALQQLKNAVGDTAEAIATAWLPSIAAAAKATKDWLISQQDYLAMWSEKFIAG